jgi:AAA+ ATPase superfamily predicted ATPase
MEPGFANPFASYGHTVTGDYFIGRRNALRVIENRIIYPPTPGNLAIIGLRKIGKSSLVYKALLEQKEKLLEKKRVPIRISLGLQEQPHGFFRKLVMECRTELRKLGWENGYIYAAAEEALQEYTGLGDKYECIQKFFWEIHQAGISVIFILDEFDRASELFKGNILGFQQLRELSDPPDLRVIFVTLSRRPIRDIELQHQSISTFDGIFHKYYLGMLEEEDVNSYFERLSAVELNITPTIKERIAFYCGGHPYLLTMLGYQIVEFFREGRSYDVDKVFDSIGQSFVEYMLSMIDYLNRDHRLNKLLQVVLGPLIDLKQIDVDELIRYGLIRPIEEETKLIYPAFSPYFESFLRVTERETDLWPLLTKTEKILRVVIANTLQEKYKENWFDKVERAHPKLGLFNGKNLFQRCREMQEREKRTWSGILAQNPLDYTYPQELIEIVCIEWSAFEHIFSKGKRMDQRYWKQRGEHIAMVRNPLAHNRAEIIKSPDRRTAEIYCQEIIDLLEVHLQEIERTASDG